MNNVDLEHDENALAPVQQDWGMSCPHDRSVLVAYETGVRCANCDRFWSYVNPVRFYPDEEE